MRSNFQHHFLTYLVRDCLYARRTVVNFVFNKWSSIRDNGITDFCLSDEIIMQVASLQPKLFWQHVRKIFTNRTHINYQFYHFIRASTTRAWGWSKCMEMQNLCTTFCSKNLTGPLQIHQPMSLHCALDTCAQRTSVCRVGDQFSSPTTLVHKLSFVSDTNLQD